MKENERHAADILKAFLAEKLNLKVSWKPGEDPPDFVFTVNSEQWAVEETQLHQYIQLRNKPESRQAIEEPLARMCERIRAAAKPAANRDYIIAVFGPVEDRKLGDIEQAVMEHIRSGQLASKQVADSVKVEVMPREARIEYMIGLNTGVMAAGGQAISADVHANLEFALNRILDQKLPRLERLEGFKRRILLITSAYLFAEAGNVSDILHSRQITEKQCDTVLLIDESGSIHWVADPGCVFK
jgi:hypothetical protein